MRLPRRNAALLLAVFVLGSCGYWRGQIESPADALADPGVDHVRLTRTDGERFEMRIAEIQGDSVYGTRGNPSYVACAEASESCTVRMPLSEVGFVEVRRLSWIRTAALVAAPVAVVLLFIAVGESCDGGGC
jgi:hypothetical protein